MKRVFTLLLFTVSCGQSIPDPLPGFPRLVLWAWERPEHLTYIVPGVTGVAYLAGTIRFTENELRVYPRLQPLFLAPGTPLIAVVRLESSGQSLPAEASVSHEILNLISHHPVRAVQIDFDARRSEQGFYRQLLDRLHRDAPGQPLEITALVSWCQGNDWLADLPIADAIPMYFRMGVDRRAASRQIREPLCRSSIGVATDEAPGFLAPHRRVFVFNPHPWTISSYRAVLTASKRWLVD